MKFEINQIKKITNSLFLAITKHGFFVSLLLFLLALTFGGHLFYKYVILIQKIEPEVSEKPFLINENNYQDVLNAWQEQEKRFNEADLKEYPSPFRKELTE